MLDYSSSRRTFLKQSSLSVLALPLGALSQLLPPNISAKKWGIILNTVRKEIEQDPRGCLDQLAEMGYTYIEGIPKGLSASEFRSHAKSVGLIPIVAGSSMGNLQETLFTRIREAHTLEHPYLTCYWPWLSDAKNLTEDEVLETADRLNEMGKLLKKEGLRFTWHNHDKEFVQIGEKTAFDLLMEHTDPQWVGVQLDLYWVYKGNHNPLELFERFPGRFDLAHIKDMDATSDRAIACVGSGIIDFQSIFQKAAEAGIQYAMVEHEKSIAGIPCAKSSIAHLQIL